VDEQVDSSVRRRAVVAAVVGTVVVIVVVVVLALQRAGASDGPGAATSRPTATDASASSATPSPAPAAPSDAEGVPVAEGGAVGEDAGAVVTPGGVPVPPLSDVAPVVVETSGQAVTADGLTVTVTVTAADVAGTGPGEYAGPGMVVDVRVGNEGASPVALVSPGVSVYSGTEGVPVNPVLTDPANVLLPAEVGAGATVEGSYRFAQASPRDAALAVAVLLSPATQPVVAQGFGLG